MLVTSVKPLRMYMFNDGLVRLCTEEYVRPTSENLGDRCMHLTNYAINKNNDNFQVAAVRGERWRQRWCRRRACACTRVGAGANSP